MRIYTSEVKIRTSKRLEVLDITDQIERTISSFEINNGMVIIWNSHTTAIITINENDPDLWKDILDKLTELVPVEGSYRHNAKYAGIDREQNAHAHILNCLAGQCTTIPLADGRLLLGTWQRILFLELDGPRSRRAILQAIGE